MTVPIFLLEYSFTLSETENQVAIVFFFNSFKHLNHISKVISLSVYIAIFLCMAKLTQGYKVTVGRKGETVEPCDYKRRNLKCRN